MKNNLEFQENYKIADFQNEYVSFLVCVYQNSQFHILFNERVKLEINQKEKKWETKKYGKALKYLIKKAERELEIPIKEISYNLPTEDIKIFKHAYIHQFPKTTEITPKELKTLHQNFGLQEKSQGNYKNILFKIQTYHLIDQNKKQENSPLGEFAQSIKMEGYLYQIHWQILYKYLAIIKFANLKPISPILLPYAIYISLLFSRNEQELGIVLWNKHEWKFFYFSRKFFLHQFSFKENINYLLEKISQKFNYEQEDMEKYLFQFLDLNAKENKSLNVYLELHNQQLAKLDQELQEWTKKYLTHTIDRMTFYIKEKLKLDLNKINFYLLGDVLKISNIETFLKSTNNVLKWNINQNIFLGLIDYRDTFLIGNAYYRHLENKLLYNQ